MKSLIIALMVTLPLAFARAEEDPRFTYVKATEAYDQAEVPMAEDLTSGTWVLVGSAKATDQTQEGTGYWPDGKIVVSHLSGHYSMLMTFNAVADAFGKPAFKLTGAAKHLEGGQTYNRYEMNGAIATNSAVFNLPEINYGDETGCAGIVECRIVASSQMLICESRRNDPSHAECQTEPNDLPYDVAGYARLSTAK